MGDGRHVMDLSGYEFETLRDDGEFALYRARQPGNPISVLVLAPVAGRPGFGSLKRLEHEYALAADLDSEWAARPLAWASYQGPTALVLEDSGGEPLERLLGQPLELTNFLGLAVGLAAAVGQVHRRGLIHKDIKPANVLVDAGGHVRLTGFGVASRLTRERQAPAPPEIIAGTLAYMAPEQTGRMNRSIDARSDLYSLGVTLYEMLAGALPFAASDPMEWVHCHIAREPTPPGERAKGVPDPVAAIILKLLAKTAEDRYQTAAGLEADLQRCLTAWKSWGRIDPFPLAARDASDRMLIPEKLYGRETEIEALVAAFDRVVTRGTTELVLVSGYAGIGKSSIVNELHKALVASRGLFAAGKFDQYKRNIPYATLAQAFQSLIRQLLSKNDTKLDRWRSALLEALGPNGQLMVNLIPELVHIIGQQPPVPDLGSRDAQNRFQMVFRRFLDVFARPEHPLALFLDDLQWLDVATLELLERLVTEPEARPLMLIGAYRDNEVGPTHPLSRTLKAIRNAGGRVHEITLAPLLLEDVERLLADALQTEPEPVQALADLVHEKTGGNPFFAIQFVAALAEEGLLAFDPEASIWQWDMDRIWAKGITDNVAELMAGKLGRLPTAALNVLRQLACLGNNAQTATLAMVLGMPEAEIHAALWELVRTGLVLRPDGGAYAFLHDRVQEAAYALIPEGERAAAHLRIGRALASRTAPAELEEKIFEIVNQLDRAAVLIDSPEEREQVAALNLMAGKRAKTSTAYASALAYFAAGRALLAEDDGERNYRLIFDLECHRAECEFLTGELAAADERLSALSQRGLDLVDRAVVARLRMALYTTLGRTDRGVEVGLEYLRHVGVEWPPHPTEENVYQELGQMRRRLAGRPIEQLIDLPLMSSRHWLAVMDVLAELLPPARFTDNNLHDLVLLRMVNLSLERGNCDASCHAYAVLNLVLGLRAGDYQMGFRFGQLGCDLVDKRGLNRFKARVYMAFGCLTIPWTKHLLAGRVLIRRAFDTANAMGDLTYAVFSFKNLITNFLIAGEPLWKVQGEAEQALEFARKARFGMYVDCFIDQLMLIRGLRGLEPDVFRPEDAGQDERWFERHLEEGGERLALAASWYWIHRMQACFLAQDNAAGIEATLKAGTLLWATKSYLEIAEYHFYGALLRAAACDSARIGQRGHLEALLAHHRQIAIWSENCPENFANRASLVEAEIARLEGRELDAMRLYEEAIRLAREHGFVQNEAIANELAARFYMARGFETIANTYLDNARHCYLRWGADGKVRQLEQAHPQLRAYQPPPAAATSGASVERLDVDTMVKASQALSSEIVLGSLIETLMRITVEHAGAERGVLILLRNGEPQIAAEAATSRGKVEVTRREKAVSSVDLPESALHYVIRTRENLILDDASVSDLLADDAYVRQRHPRSVLCLPIVTQAELAGALYLENKLTPRAFTPDRIAVLEFLASQAAISLKNAYLYADLQRSEAFLAEGQRMSHTGSWTWNIATGKSVWSAEYYRILGIEPGGAIEPAYQSFLDRVHPDDRTFFHQRIQAAVRDRAGYTLEVRIVLPDGSIKYLHEVGRPVIEESGAIRHYIGTVIDITERKHGEEALRDAQANLARAARLATMGELTTLIAHEVSQPLMAIVTNADACLSWLTNANPNVDEARQAAERVVRNGLRAGGIVKSIRTLAGKSEPEMAPFDINDAIGEILVLLRGELRRRNVSLETELSDGLQPVRGDRVQLQQVILNLIMNAIDAMSTVMHRPRSLGVSSRRNPSGDLLIAVTDVGMGLDPEKADRIFDAFFTTKLEGMGMGLAICRTIVEAHGGRLWASPNQPFGSVFQFTLPTRIDKQGSDNAA
jgi:PAS domain S-box-containing protein